MNVTNLRGAARTSRANNGLTVLAVALTALIVVTATSCGRESEPEPTPRLAATTAPVSEGNTATTAVPTVTSVESAGSASAVPIGNKVGQRVPDFSILLSDGSVARSSEILAEGKPVFLFFWATWCPVCREELQDMLKAYPDYEDGVTVYAVGLDPSESIGYLTSTATDRGYPWPVASAGHGMVRSLNILSQSSKLAFNGNGVITYRDGYRNGDANTWHRVFEELVTSN